jgi:carboxyl-terminal processing protease
MDRPFRWWVENSPLHVGLLAYQAQRGYSGRLFDNSSLLWRFPATDPEATAYRGRLLILVDRATLSAAEDLVMPFQDNGRAVILGEATGGSTGQPYYHTFDNGMAFAIGTKRATMPDGTRFEGVGIAPDIPVEVRRQDLYAHVDPVLDKAVAVARGE